MSQSLVQIVTRSLPKNWSNTHSSLFCLEIPSIQKQGFNRLPYSKMWKYCRRIFYFECCRWVANDSAIWLSIPCTEKSQIPTNFYNLFFKCQLHPCLQVITAVVYIQDTPIYPFRNTSYMNIMAYVHKEQLNPIYHVSNLCILFRQITTFIKVPPAPWPDLRVWSWKKNNHTNFYELCDLMKKYIYYRDYTQFWFIINAYKQQIWERVKFLEKISNWRVIFWKNKQHT